MTLNQLKVGQSAKISKVSGCGMMRKRLLDMGLTPHTVVKLSKIAPLGDPMELNLRGYVLTIRVADAKNIEVTWKNGEEGK